MRQAKLFDFHGTLGRVTELLPLIEKRDYDGFYLGSLSCPPIPEIVREAQISHEEGHVNLLFTGMPETYAEGLNDWLTLHQVPMDYIDMRKTGDRRKDYIVKREMYNRAVDFGYYIVHAWDDSPGVVDLYRSLGLPVTVVPGYAKNLKTGKVDRKRVA